MSEAASRVTWEIDPQEGGFSKVTVVHDQLEGAPKTAATVASDMGWKIVLGRDEDAVGDGRTARFLTERRAGRQRRPALHSRV